jgi:hypothetical protein
VLDQYELRAKLLHEPHLILRETIKQRAAEAPATLAGWLHLAG